MLVPKSLALRFILEINQTGTRGPFRGVTRSSSQICDVVSLGQFLKAFDNAGLDIDSEALAVRQNASSNGNQQSAWTQPDFENSLSWLEADSVEGASQFP